MKLKLDENVHTDVVPALLALGHDVLTVHDQKLAGHPDADIARAVQAEQRCLVTSDLSFAGVRRYPPSQFAGLVVLRLGAPTTPNQIACLTRFFADRWLLAASDNAAFRNPAPPLLAPGQGRAPRATNTVARVVRNRSLSDAAPGAQAAPAALHR